MRIDVQPENDSGGFSLVAASAVDEIVTDDRANDRQFVERRLVMLFELVGDDEIGARVVVDEPPSAEERAQVLNQVTGLLDLRGGPLLVCGGFDPRGLDAWRRDAPDRMGDVAPVVVAPGWYRVTVGCTRRTQNGRAIAAGGVEAWLAEDEDEDEDDDACDFGWLIELHRLDGDSPPDVPLTPPEDSGWFAVEAGAHTSAP